MLKKIICIMILSQLFLGTAYASGTDTLKSAFDELTYSLTVEWDQKEPEFARKAISNFRNDIAGATDEEKKIFFKSLLQNRADQEAENFVIALKNNSLSQTEAMNELNNVIAVAYNQGASFAPTKKIIIGILGGAALIFVAGLIMWELSDPQVFGEDGWK